MKEFTYMEYTVDEVYGLSRNIPLNYVERHDVDERLRCNLNRDKHITIFGSSKQGKTCLRKHCLNENDYILVQCSNRWSLSDLNANILKRAGYELTESTNVTYEGKAKVSASVKILDATLGGEAGGGATKNVTHRQLELDLSDVNDIIGALNEANFHQYIVLEDFHYLKSEVQKDFAIELKAFHESSKLCFIIVGVWLDGTIPKFSAVFVRGILDNPIYCGKIAFGRRKVEKKLGTRNEMHVVKQSEFSVYVGQHEAIVSEDAWNLAQTKRQRTTGRREKVRDPDHAHILSGILKCPCCGRNLYGNVSKAHSKDNKTRYYYFCKSIKGQTGHECSFRLNIEQNEIN